MARIPVTPLKSLAIDDPTLIDGIEPTVLMPAPGGQATVAMKRRPSARAAAASAGVELQRLVAGINPLLGAASVMLALVAQLRGTSRHDDPAGLREKLLQCLAEFESLAAASGVPRPKVTAARYLLCSFVDETIVQTPWGEDAGWGERGLLGEFHEENWGGDKAFQLLERLGQEPAANADLLELFYVCLQLGFEGRYRKLPDGRAQLDAISARLLEVIRPAHDAGVARTMALRWQGVATQGHRGVSAMPLWVVLVLGAAVVLAILLLMNRRIDEMAQPVFRQIHDAPLALRSERSAEPAKPRLAPALQADIAGGAVSVRDEAQRSVVSMASDALFVPGSAQLDAKGLALIARVAAPLKTMPGQIAVIGHTDDATGGSLQYPSNWHLSRARAQAVLAALVQQDLGTQRLRAEGRADAEPVLPNTSAANRARNRRVEIELWLPRPDE
jgi:type VI secretion system protein ImpK